MEAIKIDQIISLTNIQPQSIEVETAGKMVISYKDFENLKRKERIEKFKILSRIVKNEMDNIFENIKIVDDKEREYVKSFYNFCKNFNEIRKTGAGIYMSGSEGAGKTFYTNCIYFELRDKYPVYKTSLRTLLDEKINSFKNPSAKNEFLLKRLSEAELVIFDDLGNEMLTDWGKQEIYEIISFLYKNKISFIINTNLSDEQMTEFLMVNGSAKLMSRIKGRCKNFRFNWSDRRKDELKEVWDRYY